MSRTDKTRFERVIEETGASIALLRTRRTIHHDHPDVGKIDARIRRAECAIDILQRALPLIRTRKKSMTGDVMYWRTWSKKKVKPPYLQLETLGQPQRVARYKAYVRACEKVGEKPTSFRQLWPGSAQSKMRRYLALDSASKVLKDPQIEELLEALSSSETR